MSGVELHSLLFPQSELWRISQLSHRRKSFTALSIFKCKLFRRATGNKSRHSRFGSHKNCFGFLRLHAICYRFFNVGWHCITYLHMCKRFIDVSSECDAIYTTPFSVIEMAVIFALIYTHSIFTRETLFHDNKYCIN